jgi:serine/threonine protein kinase
MKIKLSVTEGPHKGRAFEFGGHETFIVGRGAETHFRLPAKDRYFSRHHFMVEVNPPACRLMDMASLNGTFVNGDRVTTIDLHDGDLIKGGRTVIAVRLDSGTDGPAAPPPMTSTTREPAAGIPPIPGYQVGRELGRGAMGVVYLAHRTAGGPAVALKFIKPNAPATGPLLAQFLREASVLRRLDHPGIIRFVEIGQADGRIYLATEFVDGCDAHQLLERHGGPLPIPRAVALACRALEAVGYAHENGFVHRDIKPHNLLVTAVDDADAVKLADFGLARIYQASPLSGLTLTGQFGGTVGFLAPEQITDFRDAQPTVDQYAMAATLYYLLTGRRIYDFPPRVEAQLLMILQDDPVPIRDRRPDVPAPLADVIGRALTRKPADRFPDATSLRAALSRFGPPR